MQTKRYRLVTVLYFFHFFSQRAALIENLERMCIYLIKRVPLLPDSSSFHGMKAFSVRSGI